MIVTARFEQLERISTLGAVLDSHPTQVRIEAKILRITRKDQYKLGKEDVKDTKKGIPGLVRIPILGRMFGSTNAITEKSEPVIFLTPRIVTGEGEINDTGESRD